MAASRPQNKSASHLQMFLRIKHPSIDPAELTRTLGIEPEHQIQAGTDTSTGKRRLHNESYWLASLAVRSHEELTEQLKRGNVHSLDKKKALLKAFANVTSIAEAMLLGRLLTFETQREFLRQLIQEGGSVTLLVQRSRDSDAFTLSPNVMRCFAELGIALEID